MENGSKTIEPLTEKGLLAFRECSIRELEVACIYDAAGNLLTKLTAELKKSISDKAPVTYTYDYERLSEVLYPKNLFNRVTYTYGKPGEKYNRAGRLVLVEDASGGEAYYYGNQGEVVKTVRSVMVSTADVRTYVYGATYDSWNRVRTMTYPDGEVVTYGYNAAGQVESIRSERQGKEETIVEEVGYDKEGHTVYTRLGNGTETTYTYDRQRERLQEMNLAAAGAAVMTNKYRYDAADNILGITNAIDPAKAGGKSQLGGAFSHTYVYDELNRLITASGKAKSASYEMAMTFGRMSEPLTKVQKVDSTRTAQSYDFTYRYEDDSHPTAPTQVGHDHYTYDANGNPILVENDSLNTERIVKSHGDLEGVYINGAPQGISFHETEDYTIYPAPIITVTKNRFTKHYFIGSKRIASKIGTGRFSNVYGIGGNNITAGQKDYAARMMQIEKQREEYYKQLGTPPGVPTMRVQLQIQTIQVLVTTASLQTWVTTAFLKAGYSIRSSTAKVMLLVLLSNGVNRRVLIMPSRDMAISQLTRQILRTSSSITLITSAVPRISPTLRLISPSLMLTCPMENCS